MRTPREINEEIRQLKDEMKREGIPVSSFMGRQPSMEASRANERLFALKNELEQAKASSGKTSPEKIRAFVDQQDVEPQNLSSSYVLQALTERFNSANRTQLSVQEFREALGKCMGSMKIKSLMAKYKRV